MNSFGRGAGVNLASSLSDDNRITLSVLTEKEALMGAEVHGRRLDVVISEVDQRTVKVANLAPPPGSDDICRSLAVRFQRASDTYDALVCHVRNGQAGLDYRYELIDGLYVDQLHDLLLGNVAGEPDMGDELPAERARYWEKLNQPAYLVYSQGERDASGAGFWSAEDGWVSRPENASLFSEYEKQQLKLPLCAKSDADWVPAKRHLRAKPTSSMSL